MAVELQGARVLLTGATGGIGNAIARALHERGAHLIISGRRAEVLEELASELGDRVEVKPADLADIDAVRELAESVGDVDVLVANAGLPGTGALGEYTREQVDKVLAVNLNAPVHLTHILLPKMQERGSGHLVYVGSISSKVATAWSSLYNGTKFGLRGFAFALHEELRGSGIGVTCVFPGPISDAGMWADGGLDLPRGVSARSPEQVAAAVIKGIETNKPEIDVAHPVMRLGGWLAGPAPRLIAAFNRRVGANETAERLSEAQKVKR